MAEKTEIQDRIDRKVASHYWRGILRLVDNDEKKDPAIGGELKKSDFWRNRRC